MFLVLAHVATRAWGLQWDLKVYLHAARAAAQGLDPYDPSSLAMIAGRPVLFPFLYAPITLLPFLALAALPLHGALVLWVGLKIAALGFTVHRWRRDFVPEAPWTAVALVAVFGCDAAALADLRSGNVGIFEAAFLAAAFSAWLRGRARTFGAFVVAASLFKLVPILYLGMLLVPRPDRPARPRVALGAFLAFLALIALPLVVGWPSAGGGAGFLRNVPAGFPIGEANPTLYALIETMARELPAFAGLRGGGVAIVCATLALVVIAVFGRALQRHARSRDPRRLAAAFALVEALLSPRLMQYGFVRAGLPLLFWAPTGPRAGAASAQAGSTGILAWAVLVSLPGILRWASHPLTSGLWMAYVPLVFLVIAFVVALRSRESPTV